jgi:DNA-binding CsgD family transcriptional regulator/PAS domain-containing protein
MSEDDGLGCVVASVYDAALNPMLWSEALARIAAFVGGQPGALTATDLIGKFVKAGHQVGPDLQYMQMQAEAYGGFDPLTTMPLVEIRQYEGLPELHDECCNKATFRPEWAPQGDGASAGLETSQGGCRFFSVLRNGARDKANATIDDDMRRRMSLVAPHARRAVLIGKAIDQKANEAAAFADILDTLSAGLFLIDIDGQIVHANAAGREILDADDFLGLNDGRLVAHDTDGNSKDIFANGCDLQIGSKGIALPLIARDGECHVAHVLPLGAGAGHRPGGPRTVAAAVFVFKATLETPSSPDVIRRAYQLTPAELRVLLAIVNVGGIPEVATALGVADSTIKTHVRRLFDKTGAGRQADLVKLVAGFFSPLVA